MTGPGDVSLMWSLHEEKKTSAVTSLWIDKDFLDVTIVCDDGQLSAHKVILAASSSFFSSVFQMNPHNHPLMYLRGVKTDQMQSVLQFL